VPRSRTSLSVLSLVLCLATHAIAQNAPKAVGPQQFAGEYAEAADPETLWSFYEQNGKLILEGDRIVPTELKTISPTEFQVPEWKLTLKFQVGPGGKASFSFTDDGETVTAERKGEPVHHLFHDYQRTDVMIPMRDGVKLHTVILKPSDISASLPLLITRTPYGVDGTTRFSFFNQRPELARAGYIYVAQDIRGRFKSEGQFVMSRPMTDHADKTAVDESTDSWDTVEWLLKNVSGNNGRAGFVGTSYPGFLAMAGGIDPHPAVKAVSPQAPMIDVWLGDDFFHNGAFRQTYGNDYALSLETSKEMTDVAYKDASGKPVDGYDYFLRRGSFEADVKQSGSKMLPTWQLFLDHPAYDKPWSSRGVEHHLTKVAVPTLSVGGYYDQEDMFGPQLEYNSLEPHDDQHENFLVLGPWRHGYWSSSSRHLGNLQYGEPIGKEFRAQIEAPFFAHYLKGEPGQGDAKFDLEDTASFQTGTNTWKRYSHFPPEGSQPTPLHFVPGGKLTWADVKTAGKTDYTSDPANPIPYRQRPIQPTYGPGSKWFNWLTEDQRFVADRKDVAVFKLPVLKEDLVVTGEVLTDLFVSTSGTDTDLVAKLIDQYPDDDPDPVMRGYQLMTNSEIFRGRYLDGFDRPRAIRANSIREYKFSLHDIDHVFKAGHTVVIQVQSSWFPLYDRNPQTFVPNIMTARPEDYKPATISIYSGPDHDSTLQMPLMNACDHIECF
jgi:hypothetical protein